MKSVENLTPVARTSRPTKKTIMTRTVYEARWSSVNSTTVVVLGYLGKSTWKVHCLITRKETEVKTSQLHELDPMDMRHRSRPAKTVRVHDEILARGTLCELVADESASLYESSRHHAKFILSEERPSCVASVDLKKGTRVTVVRDAKWRREILPPRSVRPQGACATGGRSICGRFPVPL